MSDVTQSELLINALLDGQLDAVSADRARQQIAADAQMQAMLIAFQEQRSAIAGLPKFQLDDDFAQRVLEIGTAEAKAIPMFDTPPATSIDWKKYAISLAAIAALLMAMLVYQWAPASQRAQQTVAVLSPVEQTDASPSSKAADGNQQVNQGLAVSLAIEDTDRRARKLSGWPAFKSGAPVSPAMQSVPEPVQAVASAAVRGTAGEREVGASAPAADALNFKRGVPPKDFAFTGTAMSAPKPQSPPAIDQVWLLQVSDTFSQDQLVEALTDNSISVPAELQRVDAEDVIKAANVNEVDGIHVAANPSQMKNALSQLSKSEAVTICAFQLPNLGSPKVIALPDVKKANSNGVADVPASIVAPQRAIAQKLRGNFFAPPSPSSKVPATFNELEKMMGFGNSAQATESTEVVTETLDEQNGPNDDDSLGSGEADQDAEMEELFPDSALESEELRNFLILIRNGASGR